MAEIIGGRAERGGEEFDDVAPRAVEIDGEPEEGRGHELRLAESARPGAGQMIERNVAAIGDLQRRHQLGAEIGGALALQASVLSDCTSGRPPMSSPKFDSTPQIAASTYRLDAEPRLGLGERARFARHRRLAVDDALVVDEAGHVVPDRRLEFGLAGLEIEHLRVGLQASKAARSVVADTPCAAASARSEATQEAKSARAGSGQREERGEAEKARFMASSSAIRSPGESGLRPHAR